MPFRTLEVLPFSDKTTGGTCSFTSIKTKYSGAIDEKLKTT